MDLKILNQFNVLKYIFRYGNKIQISILNIEGKQVEKEMKKTIGGKSESTLQEEKVISLGEVEKKEEIQDIQKRVMQKKKAMRRPQSIKKLVIKSKTKIGLHLKQK